MRTRLQLVSSGLVVVALLLAACGAPTNDYSAYMLRPSGTDPTNGAVKVTWYGTTMFLLDDGETQLLFDAFITRPSLKTVVRSTKTGEALLQTDTPLADAWLARPEVRNPAAIFIAHSHYDHVMDVAYIANQTGARVYGSDSTLNLARGGGVPEAQLNRNQLMKPLAIGKFTVTVLPGRHRLNPPPLPDDRDLLIGKPLPQPYRVTDLVEGGSFNFLIQHGNNNILINGANYVGGGFYGVRADVAFIVVPWYGEDQRRQDDWYAQTVAEVQPHLVVPTHWDDFFAPLSNHLEIASATADDAWDYVIKRLSTDGRQFGVMQGYQSIMLFESK